MTINKLDFTVVFVATVAATFLVTAYGAGAAGAILIWRRRARAELSLQNL